MSHLDNRSLLQRLSTGGDAVTAITDFEGKWGVFEKRKGSSPELLYDETYHSKSVAEERARRLAERFKGRAYTVLKVDKT